MGICQGPECDRETEPFRLTVVNGLRRCSSCGLVLPESHFEEGLLCCHSCGARFKRYTQGPGGSAVRRQQSMTRRHRMEADPMVARARKLLVVSRGRAKKKGMQFDLALEDLGVLPVRCPCLGLELNWLDSGGVSDPTAPTLDRIDNAIGYVPGNVWVISMKANRIKSDSTPDELARVAAAVLGRLGR